MGGFYYADRNHIDMIDHYYLISILSHEMRHAFQYIYYPDLYYATEYGTAREYLDCYIERDARGYSLDYCVAREYWEEADFIREDEEQLELVIQKRLSAKSRGISERFFRLNPAEATTVSRDYHVQKSSTSNDPQTDGGDKVVVFKKKKRIWSSLVDTVRRVVRLGLTLIVGLFLLSLLFFIYT
ncbi:hypothetical protein [Alkalihalobacterium elongatum]|uniref:hypothetical protein n=1 Tax=Alkalihalobacterium elongatum TaxID=2675466 RepID=UPI001C1FBF5E|nr:hypothetical protein [Alkalihalobacterium elongatum]